jgi:hypothetical protein
MRIEMIFSQRQHPGSVCNQRAQRLMEIPDQGSFFAPSY